MMYVFSGHFLFLDYSRYQDIETSTGRCADLRISLCKYPGLSLSLSLSLSHSLSIYIYIFFFQGSRGIFMDSPRDFLGFRFFRGSHGVLWIFQGSRGIFMDFSGSQRDFYGFSTLMVSGLVLSLVFPSRFAWINIFQGSAIQWV